MELNIKKIFAENTDQDITKLSSREKLGVDFSNIFELSFTSELKNENNIVSSEKREFSDIDKELGNIDKEFSDINEDIAYMIINIMGEINPKIKLQQLDLSKFNLDLENIKLKSGNIENYIKQIVLNNNQDLDAITKFKYKIDNLDKMDKLETKMILDYINKLDNKDIDNIVIKKNTHKIKNILKEYDKLKAINSITIEHGDINESQIYKDIFNSDVKFSIENLTTNKQYIDEIQINKRLIIDSNRYEKMDPVDKLIENKINFTSMNSEIRSQTVESENKGMETNIVRKDFLFEDIISNVNYMKDKNIQKINITITPEEFGQMDIELTKSENESRLLINLTDSESFDIINNNIKELSKHLVNLDISIDNIEIKHSLGDSKSEFSSTNSGNEFNKRESHKNHNKKYNKEKNSNGNIYELQVNDDVINILA